MSDPEQEYPMNIKQVRLEIQPTVEQMNEDVAEWLDPDFEWHNNKGGYCKICGHHSCMIDNPDYSQGAGIIELLKAMMEREENWIEFCTYLWKKLGEYVPQLIVLQTFDFVTTPVALLRTVWQYIQEINSGK